VDRGGGFDGRDLGGEGGGIGTSFSDVIGVEVVVGDGGGGWTIGGSLYCIKAYSC